MASQRESAFTLSPPWLRTGAGQRYLYNLGLASDALLEKMQEGMVARMPGEGTDSALPYLGADRVMVQGPGELNSAFAARLTRAFETWQHAGSRPAILKQALGYVASQDAIFDTPCPVATIVRASGGGAYASWSTYYSGDSFNTQPPANVRVAPANWNWDGQYWRPQAFLVLFFPTHLRNIGGTTAAISSASGGFADVSGLSGIPTDVVGNFILLSGCTSGANNGAWQVTEYLSTTSVRIANVDAVSPDASDGAISWDLLSFPTGGPQLAWDTPGLVWDGDGLAWDLNCDPGYVKQLQALVRLWHSAGTYYPSIIFSFAPGTGAADGQFTPYGTAGANNPGGDWGTGIKVVDGVVVPSRNTNLSGYGSVERFTACAMGTAVFYPDCYLPSGT